MEFGSFFAYFHLFRHLRMIQPFQRYAKTFCFRQAFRQKNRLKIALQVSKLGFSPIVMPQQKRKKKIRRPDRCQNKIAKRSCVNCVRTKKNPWKQWTLEMSASSFLCWRSLVRWKVASAVLSAMVVIVPQPSSLGAGVIQCRSILDRLGSCIPESWTYAGIAGIVQELPTSFFRDASSSRGPNWRSKTKSGWQNSFRFAT